MSTDSIIAWTIIGSLTIFLAGHILVAVQAGRWP